MRHFTFSLFISSRVMVMSRVIHSAFLSSDSLAVVIFTCVPGLPRSFLMASSIMRSLVVTPSIFMILSPGIIWAFQAGVLGSGVTTVSQPSLVSTLMPIPPNSPSVSLFTRS